MQAIGHAGDQVAGAHQGGHAHLALQHQQDDQNVAQDLDGHADKAHRAVSRAFAAAELAGGLFNLVAGLTALVQKATLLSKKAQHIQAGQQVLERADARRLPLGAQPPSCSSLFSNSFGSAHMMSADTSEAAISDQCRLSSTTMPQSTWDALPTQLKKGFQASCSICLISLVIQERYSPLSCLW